MNNPEKQAPGRAEWGDLEDKLRCGPCRPPEPDYSYKHAIGYLRIDPKITDPNARGWPRQEDLIKLGSVRHAGRLAPSMGGWVAFCREPGCRGILEEDYFHGEYVCNECGMVDESPAFEQNNEHMRWETPAPQDRKERSLVMIDRRIENIIKSLEGDERITDLAFGKHALLRDKYNEIYQPPIDSNDARNSYVRFVDRQNGLIDHLANQILSACWLTDQRKKIYYARTYADTWAEKCFPGRFIYTGTTRQVLRYNRHEMKMFNDRALAHCRKRQVEDIIKNPKAPIILSRNYKADGKTHKIVFTITGTKIYMSGDESNQKFENFFLDHALKTGRLGEITKCPGTKKICKRHKDAMIADFRDRFSKTPGFREATFYDAAPYLPAR